MQLQAHEIRADLSAAAAEMRLRISNMTRYPGQLALEIFLPVLFAAMPIFLSQTVPGSDVATNFSANAGTTNYVAYLLIGSTAYIMVTRAFWDVAFWLRYEQMVGTLEAIYLTPTNSVVLASGVSFYSAIRSLTAGLIAYLLGCLIFGVNPLQGQIGLAFVFLLVGLPAVYGIAFLFGALVIKIKEMTALINMMQWGFAFLMGVYYPLSMLPDFFSFLALLLPATWLVNGVRSAILGVGYFLGAWYYDLAVLAALSIFVPIFSIRVFKRTERNIRRRQGIGQF